MHTGLFASSEDKQYLMIEIRGSKVALVSYLDGAGQASALGKMLVPCVIHGEAGIVLNWASHVKGQGW